MPWKQLLSRYALLSFKLSNFNIVQATQIKMFFSSYLILHSYLFKIVCMFNKSESTLLQHSNLFLTMGRHSPQCNSMPTCRLQLTPSKNHVIHVVVLVKPWICQTRTTIHYRSFTTYYSFNFSSVYIHVKTIFQKKCRQDKDHHSCKSVDVTNHTTVTRYHRW